MTYREKADVTMRLPRGDYLVLSDDVDISFITALGFDEWLTMESRGQYLLFERKTIGDFYKSLQDNRLNLQLQGVDGLLLEFCYIPKVIDWERVYDAMNGIAHEAPVFHIRNVLHLGRTLRRYEAQLKRGEYYQVKLRADIVDLTSPQLTILAQFPGIGEKRAIKLLEHYGTLYDALADVIRWDEVDGIGKETARKCWFMAQARYGKEVETVEQGRAS